MRPSAKTTLLTTLAVITAAWAASALDHGCRYCGMTPTYAAHSWMEFHHTGKDPVGVCSLHCGAVHMALHPNEPPSRILVTDYLHGGLTDADRAHWVLGGDIPGVMTRRAKWAFREGSDARRFIGEHGGEPVTFDTALRGALEDMRADTLLIQRMRHSQGNPVPSPDR